MFECFTSIYLHVSIYLFKYLFIGNKCRYKKGERYTEEKRYIPVYINKSIRFPHLMHVSVFLISSYGAPLAHRASYLALHSSLFGPVAQLIMIILSVTALTLS